MNFILRLFLTFSSVSYFIIVYLVQNDIYPQYINTVTYKWLMCFGYLLIPVLLTLISICICKMLSKDEIKKIVSIETSNNDFLANYLAFFFVALSVKDNGITFWVVFGLTILFTFFSRVSYFNPMLLLFGYHFYYVHTQENVKVMLISKQKIKSPKDFTAMNVKRINDYTFIEA